MIETSGGKSGVHCPAQLGASTLDGSGDWSSGGTVIHPWMPRCVSAEMCDACLGFVSNSLTIGQAIETPFSSFRFFVTLKKHFWQEVKLVLVLFGREKSACPNPFCALRTETGLLLDYSFQQEVGIRNIQKCLLPTQCTDFFAGVHVAWLVFFLVRE